MFTFESVTTDDETGTTVARFDDRSGPPSLAVASLIADLKDCDPRDLPVLYDTIDPDALDALFRDTRTPAAKGAVSFRYDGYDVTVSPGSISARPHL